MSVVRTGAVKSFTTDMPNEPDMSYRITSSPPMYGRRTSGTMTEPSAC